MCAPHALAHVPLQVRPLDTIYRRAVCPSRIKALEGSDTENIAEYLDDGSEKHRLMVGYFFPADSRAHLTSATLPAGHLPKGLEYRPGVLEHFLDLHHKHQGGERL
jgi:hypothetical protein